MFGVLGEDQTDADSVKVLVRRLARDDHLPVKTRGFDGFGDLLKKGAAALKALAGLGCERFVVAHDADGDDPAIRRRTVKEKVVTPAGLDDRTCIVIPVQALEAWILADIEAARRVFTGWRPEPIANPEGIADPKRHLERCSRAADQKPRYTSTIHNRVLVGHLSLDVVAAKCPSFRPLRDFVRDPAD